MKQLEAPRGTRVVMSLLFYSFEGGLFKRQRDGRVFYLSMKDGQREVFPVLQDGSILREAVPILERPRPREQISVMHPASLNINGIKWTEKSAQKPA